MNSRSRALSSELPLARSRELRFQFHQIIKAIHHRADGRFAANYFVKSARFSHTVI
jgi:hypothetical protein